MNSQVEGIFRGIVLIILSWLESFARLLIAPWSAFVGLVAQRRNEAQIKPYAFALFALVGVFFLPTVVDALKSPARDDFHYNVYDSAFPQPGGLGRAYEQANKQIESKAAVSMVTASVVWITFLHVGFSAIGALAFRHSARRALWRNSLFFIAGLQGALFGLTFFIEQFALGGSSQFSMFRSLLTSPYTMIFAEDEWMRYFLLSDCLYSSLLVILLIVPCGVAWRFGRRADGIRIGGGRVIAASRILPVLLALGSNFVFFTSLAAATYVLDEIRLREKSDSPFEIDYLYCSLVKDASGSSLKATAVLTVADQKAWFFDEGDFEMRIHAARLESDPSTPSKRIGAGKPQTASFSALSPKLGSPPFLLQRGQAVLASFELKMPPDWVAFMDTHKNSPRCTLNYTRDYPIGEIGAINVE